MDPGVQSATSCCGRFTRDHPKACPGLLPPESHAHPPRADPGLSLNNRPGMSGSSGGLSGFKFPPGFLWAPIQDQYVTVTNWAERVHAPRIERNEISST